MVSTTQAEFASWLLMSRRERELGGLPPSQAKWAEARGVTDRTLRRWKNDAQFQRYLAELRGDPVEDLPEPAPKAAGGFTDELSPDEQQYESVKSEIARQAKGGDAKALELYLKYWGQEHLRRERAENELLAGMSDGELVREVVGLLGVELVAATLADL